MSTATTEQAATVERASGDPFERGLQSLPPDELAAAEKRVESQRLAPIRKALFEDSQNAWEATGPARRKFLAAWGWSGRASAGSSMAIVAAVRVRSA